jgi:hypothetical protein
MKKPLIIILIAVSVLGSFLVLLVLAIIMLYRSYAVQLD